MIESGRVAVVGAASQIGRFLLPRLAEKGVIAYRIGRNGSMSDHSELIHRFDSAQGIFIPNLASADVVISLAPLPVIGQVIEMAKVLGAKRIIAFGSTGRFSKVGSSSAIEQDFVEQQVRAEELFRTQCEAMGIFWTLFRPTMIYGADADQNIAFIKTLIHRFGVFPIPWGARGLRQPVHADDLAAACVDAMSCEATLNRTYNLAGGGVLSYPEMVKRVFVAEGKVPRLIPIPAWLYLLLIEIVRRVPGCAFVRAEMVKRMFADLTADNRPAERDFGYKPRAFLVKE